MRSFSLRWYSQAMVAGLILFSSMSFGQTAVTQSYNMDGVLTDNSGNPIASTNAEFTITIYDPAQQCQLYREQQIVSLSSDGAFNLSIGSEMLSAKRIFGDPGLPMEAVFSNGTAKSCGSGSGIGLYTPISGDYRVLKISVDPDGSGGSTYAMEDFSSQIIRAVPQATVADRAESLQGLTPASLLLVNSSGPYSLTQTNLESIFTAANYAKLQTLLTYNPADYIRTGTNGSISVPALATDPGSPAAGQIWYDSTGNALKYYNGSGVQTLSSGGSGTVTSVVAGTGLNVGGGPGGIITTTGTLNVNVGTGPSQIVQLDAASKLPAVDGSLLTNITAASVSGTVHTQNFKLFDSDSSNYAQLVAPATGVLTSNYTLTLPSGMAASNGQLLSGDMSGQLSFRNLGVADIKSSIGANPQFFPTTCTATQTLVWNSLTDQMDCTNIGTVASATNAVNATTAVSFSGALVGDVTGTQGATVVEKIRGVNVVVTAPTFNQVLKFDGTNWVPSSDAGLTAETDPNVQAWAKQAPSANFATTGNTLELTDTVVAGSAGSASSVPTITYDAKGRITATSGNAYQDASAAQKGIVQVGSNINVAGGVISLDATSITGALGYTPQTNLGYTPVNKAGDTMTGGLTVGGDLLVSGNLGLNQVAADPNTAGWNATQKGYAWFNSTSNEIKYWDGSSIKVLGVAGSGLTSLNGETGSAQTFAIGATGTAPAFSSGSNTHTLNIPLASGAGVTSGTISKPDYDAFSAKLGTSTSFSGDVSGNYNSTSVDKIKGKAINAGVYASGQFLRYDGTDWVNALLSAGDIPNLDAAKIATGTLPVDRGGTGAATLGSGNLLVGAGTGAVTSLASGSIGNVIYGSGAATWSSGSPDTAGLVDKSSVQTITGAKAFSSNLQMNGANEIRFADADSDHYVGFKSPATVTADKIWVLPDQDGSANQVLKTDGSGNLGWVTALTSGTGFIQGGNSFGATAELGTNDNYNLEIETNGTTKMTVLANGNVGIGITAPGTILDIAGAQTFREMAAPPVSPSDQGRIYFDSTANKFKVSEHGGAYVDLVGPGGGSGDFKADGTVAMTGTFRAGNGSDVSPGITFVGEGGLDTGIYRPLENTIGFTTNGSEKMRITAGGWVGIGTTNPNNLIEVPGLLNFASGGGSGKDVFIGTYASHANTNGANIAIGEYAQQSIGAGDSNNIAIGHSAFRSASGSDNTALGPNSLRNTNGFANTALGSYAGYFLSSGNENIFVGVNAGNNLTNGTHNILIGTDINATSVTANNTLNIGNLLFSNDISGTGSTMSSGNLGIANKYPAALLDLGTSGSRAGDIRLAGSTSGYVQIQTAAAAGSWTMTLPTNAGTNGQVLTTDGSGGTSWAIASSGDITDVTAGAGLTGGASNGSATIDIGAGTGIVVNANDIAVDAGTSADQIVQLDSSARLPAVDGSQLTGFTASQIPVLNDVFLSSSAPRMISVQTTSFANGQNLNVSAGAGSGGVDLQGGNLQLRSGASTGTGSSSIGFYTPTPTGSSSGLNNPTQKMTILGNGNVGIGTASPSNLLVVAQSTDTNPATPSTYGFSLTSLGASIVQIGGDTNYAYLQTGGSKTLMINSQGMNDVILTPGGAGGNVGIGTSTPPRAKLDVNGTILGKPAFLTTPTVDFSSGNNAYTNSVCAAFNLWHLKDGGSYSLVIKNGTVNTCTFNAYSDGGATGLIVHLPPDHGPTISGKHTMYNFSVFGSDVYVSWTPGY